MKAAKIAKTNAARLLDSLSILYEVRTYEVDPNDLTVTSVARKIGPACGTSFQDTVDPASASPRSAGTFLLVRRHPWRLGA